MNGNFSEDSYSKVDLIIYLKSLSHCDIPVCFEAVMRLTFTTLGCDKTRLSNDNVRSLQSGVSLCIINLV